MTRKNEILLHFKEFINENNRKPSGVEFQDLYGINKDHIRYYFGSYALLAKAADSVDIDDLTILNNAATQEDIKNSKVFVITAAVSDSPVDARFLTNLKAYCKDRKATLLVQPCANIGRGINLDKALKGVLIVRDSIKLNNNFTVVGVKESSRTVDLPAGFRRLGQKIGSLVFPSTKQRLKFVATGVDSLPHAIMSTGAVTKPAYNNPGLLINKASYVAHNDHVMGAIVVEVQDERIFHFRQLQMDKHGGFVDLGNYYVRGKRKKMAPEALVLGDWHSGETSLTCKSQWKQLSNRLGVKRWIIHDLFNGTSISHHDNDKLVTLAKKAKEGLLDLREELESTARDLSWMTRIVKEVVVVKSNHDEHLDRYLQEARYVKHPHNHRIALDLAAAFIDGLSPLQAGLSICGLKNKQIKWLERDESYKIAGIELGMHGDKGANGGFSSIMAMENAYGNVVFGHKHSPEILRGAWCVGTSSELRLDYTSGPSSWMNTSCLIYPNGCRQLINLIEGSYAL